jgi:hypothetical protein
MKSYTLPKWAWIASHVLIILSLIFVTIFLKQVVAPTAGSWVGFAIAAIWCFAGGLCVVFALGFAKLVAKK